MKQKVAIISSLTGGLGHYCAHLVKPLSQFCDLKFITYPQVDLSGAVTNQITDTFVKRLIKWPRFDLVESEPTSIVEICAYLKERKFNVVNIHVGTTVKRKIYYFSTFLQYAKQINNMKFVFTLHDVLPFDEDKKLTPLLKSFYKLADHCIVGNELERDRLRKHFKIPDEKITVVHIGTFNLFNHDLYDPMTAKSYLGIPKNKKILLFFGFLREYKGFEELIKAANILKKKRDDFIVYVGSGLKYAPKTLVANCMKMISKYNLSSHFELNLNYLDTSEIEAVFKASDIVVLPYIHVSQSAVLMMATGFARPAVITDIFHDKKWVDGKAGLVAERGNYQDLAKKLAYLLDNPEEASEMGKFGYKYAEQHFNWNLLSEKYAQVYSKMVE